ncbi:hypothetical protein NA56DRAFT_575802, partial [Hyaloscypha hepaticicola]
MNFKSGYRYSTLEGSDSIRLLQIETVGTTAQGRGPIRCWIRHFSLSNAPPYRALSYAWGLDSTKKMFMNDKIEISADGNTKWVWIEALCIDLSNEEERNLQVGRMGTIYTKAAEVLVWLG